MKRAGEQIDAQLILSGFSSLPIELWHKVVAYLTSLCLRCEDFEPLLNLVGTSLEAARFVRPAFCRLLRRMEVGSDDFGNERLRFLSVLPDFEKKMEQPGPIDLSSRQYHLQEYAAVQNLQKGLELSPLFYRVFIRLAVQLPRLDDEALRELVYTIHIVQMYVRFLSEKKFGSELSVASLYAPGDKKPMEFGRGRLVHLGELFFDVWAARAFLGVDVRDAIVKLEEKVLIGEVPGYEADESIPRAPFVDPSEEESEESEEYPFQKNSEDTLLEFRQQEQAELKRILHRLEPTGKKNILSHSHVPSFLSEPRAPLLPLNMLPGLLCAQLGKNGGIRRAYEIAQGMEEPKRAIHFGALENWKDDKSTQRAIAYSILSAAKHPDACLFYPEPISSIDEAVFKGQHFLLPREYGFDFWNSYVYYFEDDDLTDDVLPVISIRHKIRALDLHRTRSFRDKLIKSRLNIILDKYPV